MGQHDLNLLLGLAGVMIVALGAVLLLLRLGSADEMKHNVLLLGYPPEHFPARDLARSAPLIALAATQARLASIYTQLPQQTDLAVWLRAFLNELREIMDTAYRVALITAVYGQPSQLDRLISEVQEIEAQVAEHVARQLLARDGDAQHELLDGRLATLRMCLRELATLTEVRAPATWG